MKKLKKYSLFFIIVICAHLICSKTVFGSEISINITKQYLNLPVSQQEERSKMTFSINDKVERSFVIRLSETPEYWVFVDVSEYKGKTLIISYEGNTDGLRKIEQSDIPVGAQDFYKEENRPQLHFTTRCGWINDPNGLIFYEGEYHLFYQHNPYEREWENMHWGHAVSRDLIYWEELPIALFPDEHGTMFSGSAVIDYENTSGFGDKKTPPMVAIYTADNPKKQVQCIAYSLDKGRTWTKYDKNPVIDSKEKWNSKDTRDPKVFWYQKGKHWVMVLNERDGHSIYTSPNLKNWTYQSHVTGFWECPELFELPIDDNPSNTKWVMYGASGTYMLGDFDGKKFTPQTGKLPYTFGALFAAQTFNNIPETDGRRIQIAWDRVDHPGMRFKGQMSLPSELTLHKTPDGIRLFNNPIKELDALHEKNVISEKNITSERANELLKTYSNNSTLRIKVNVKMSHATFWVLALFGQNIIDYNYNFNTINGFFYSPLDIASMEVSADIFIDKTTIQVYLDGGAMSYCMQRIPRKDNREGFRFWSDRDFEIKNFEVFTMKSIWKK